MSNVTRIRQALPVSPEISEATDNFDLKIASAIDEAKAAGLPQGFLLAVLQGHAHAQAHIMVTSAGVPK